MAHDNTVINELHSLLEQAPEQTQRRGIDEVLIASEAGRDCLSDRSAHVLSSTANDIGWLPTTGFYYYRPLSSPEARPPSTTSIENHPSAAGGRSELSNPSHLSIPAASHQHVATPHSNRES